MGRPVLGAETKARIIAMAQAGSYVGEIHMKLALPVTIQSVYQTISRARQAGHVIPPFPRRRGPGRPSGVVQVLLWKAEHVEPLDAAAKQRGLSRVALVNRLVAVIAESGLIDAILDDGAGA